MTKKIKKKNFGVNFLRFQVIKNNQTGRHLKKNSLCTLAKKYKEENCCSHG